MNSKRGKEEATKYANKLLNKLNGLGWKIRVWENCGWHSACCNKKFGITVYDTGGRYYAMVEPSYIEFYGKHKEFKDPNKAVKYILKSAFKAIDEMCEIGDRF